MKKEKKEFSKPEIEVVNFEKTDVIATSTVSSGGWSGGEAIDLGDL